MTDIKRSDQIAMLETCAKFTDAGEWSGLFTYPNCGYDLVLSGLVAEDKKITIAGRAALFFLEKGPDPTLGKSFIEIPIPLQTVDHTKDAKDV